jgi:hypothetical protein
MEDLIDEEKRTIGHYCVIFKAFNCINYLKSKEVRFNFNLKDIYGNNAMEEAARLNIAIPGL